MRRVGADIGGTFTDLIAWSEGHRPVLDKTPSTLDTQADGILRAVADHGADEFAHSGHSIEPPALRAS